MSLLSPRISMIVSAQQPPAAPPDGAVLCEIVYNHLLSNGTGSGQADLVAHKEYTIAGSGTQSVDLTTLTDPYGTALAAAQVVGLLIVNHEYLSDGTTLGGGVCNVSPNASNGWTSLLADASDVLKIPRGGSVAVGAARTGLAVGASNKVLDLENPGSSSIRVEIIVLARSA